MSLSVFFQPIDWDTIAPIEGYNSLQLGNLIDAYVKNFPDLESEDKPHLALMGVLEDRNSIGQLGSSKGPDVVRKSLYSLSSGGFPLKMVDLGNILAGETIEDTYIAVKNVCEELMKADIIPIILGGSQDITYAQYQAYEQLERTVEVTIIDSKFDLDEHNTENTSLHSQSYLNHIILHEPDYLFNLNNVGYQSYFVSHEAVSLYEKLYFNAIRLGQVMGKIEDSEPAIRCADMVSFDMSAIRFSDAPGSAHVTSNGFFGQEACQMSRYAGMNDKLSSIGFYEFNPSLDHRNQTSMLLAQMIWYFIDGFYARKNDIPFIPKNSYITYRATLEADEHELVFIKSKKSDRWWMQVPYFGSRSVNERYYLVPCRYEDYQVAVRGEMPDLWWKTHQKLV